MAPARDTSGRNTPTGVGKTTDFLAPPLAQRKHPHGRGEDSVVFRRQGLQTETPPRAWGRPDGAFEDVPGGGNTPTGVGKTAGCQSVVGVVRKHPHGRGEDTPSRGWTRFPSETPPRAWGRHRRTACGKRRNRNTPTGVGKTYELGAVWGRWEETPPRAWGRPSQDVHKKSFHGNTPTGVGKTNVSLSNRGSSWKHPHGRGEDSHHAV